MCPTGVPIWSHCPMSAGRQTQPDRAVKTSHLERVIYVCGEARFAGEVMNQLNVSTQQSIITLLERGWSQRRIARELRLDRSAVDDVPATTLGSVVIFTAADNCCVALLLHRLPGRRAAASMN